MGALLLRRTRPAVVDLTHWHARPDAKQLRADQQFFEAAGRAGTAHAIALGGGHG
jgi:hypothetical protein